jgi:hypothetical protein
MPFDFSNLKVIYWGPPLSYSTVYNGYMNTDLDVLRSSYSDGIPMISFTDYTGDSNLGEYYKQVIAHFKTDPIDVGSQLIVSFNFLIPANTEQHFQTFIGNTLDYEYPIQNFSNQQITASPLVIIEGDGQTRYDVFCRLVKPGSNHLTYFIDITWRLV